MGFRGKALAWGGDLRSGLLQRPLAAVPIRLSEQRRGRSARPARPRRLAPASHPDGAAQVRSLQGLARAIDRLNEGIGVSVAWLALFTVLVEFAVVLMRYVFGVGSVKMQESIVYMHATVFMVAAGYTLLHNGHVRCDIFYAAATPRRQGHDRSDRRLRVPAADLRADRLGGMALRRGGVGGA